MDLYMEQMRVQEKSKPLPKQESKAYTKIKVCSDVHLLYAVNRKAETVKSTFLTHLTSLTPSQILSHTTHALRGSKLFILITLLINALLQQYSAH